MIDTREYAKRIIEAVDYDLFKELLYSGDDTGIIDDVEMFLDRIVKEVKQEKDNAK
jgi:hypothetical protein